MQKVDKSKLCPHFECVKTVKIVRGKASKDKSLQKYDVRVVVVK